jgi:hypothetical protein
MKKLLQPKVLAILAFAIAVFFVAKNEFKGANDIAPATSQKDVLCPVHKIRLKLDTVMIALEKEPDSVYAANRAKYFPMAQDTFYLLEWYKDDDHKNLKRSEVWYCPACRTAKEKYLIGQVM